MLLPTDDEDTTFPGRTGYGGAERNEGNSFSDPLAGPGGLSRYDGNAGARWAGRLILSGAPIINEEIDCHLDRLAKAIKWCLSKG